MDIFTPIDTPHQYTLPAKGFCQHADVITQLMQSELSQKEWRKEIKEDLKEIKESVQNIQTLKVQHEHHKEAVVRAFDRIDKLEKHKIEVEAFINQVQGMKLFAWAVWTVLASGLGLVVLKVFSVTGSLP